MVVVPSCFAIFLGSLTLKGGGMMTCTLPKDRPGIALMRGMGFVFWGLGAMLCFMILGRSEWRSASLTSQQHASGPGSLLSILCTTSRQESRRHLIAHFITLNTHKVTRLLTMKIITPFAYA